MGYYKSPMTEILIYKFPFVFRFVTRRFLPKFVEGYPCSIRNDILKSYLRTLEPIDFPSMFPVDVYYVKKVTLDSAGEVWDIDTRKMTKKRGRPPKTN
jgi:hypothetical protein